VLNSIIAIKVLFNVSNGIRTACKVSYKSRTLMSNLIHSLDSTNVLFSN